MGESLLDSPPTFLEESLLACGAFFSDCGTHSKAPLCWSSEDYFTPPLFQKLAGFSSFFREILRGGLYITLGLGLERFTLAWHTDHTNPTRQFWCCAVFD
jgi:hypothetical protein